MSSTMALRRLLCCCSGASPILDKGTKTKTKKNIVFMGSPQLSASVFDALFNASQAPGSDFQIAAVVTQPPSVRDRGRKLVPSPVAMRALDHGLHQECIFTPQQLGEEAFLSEFRSVEPVLCITAAYGKILPNKFLEIPDFGTVNIHPSLLPQYRGAAPVQRALQDGVTETGVSLAYTVRALDSGPIIAHEVVEVNESIKAPELLAILFDIGSELLIRELPSIFDGSAKLKAQPQDEQKATSAPKLSPEDSWLSFDEEARKIHNKVRAFAGWPGTRARLQLIANSGIQEVLEIKVITTAVYDGAMCLTVEDGVQFVEGKLLFPCANNSWLEVLELQIPGRKISRARDFWNGHSQKLIKLAT